MINETNFFLASNGDIELNLNSSQWERLESERKKVKGKRERKREREREKERKKERKKERRKEATELFFSYSFLSL